MSTTSATNNGAATLAPAQNGNLHSLARRNGTNALELVPTVHDFDIERLLSRGFSPKVNDLKFSVLEVTYSERGPARAIMQKPIIRLGPFRESHPKILLDTCQEMKKRNIYLDVTEVVEPGVVSVKNWPEIFVRDYCDTGIGADLLRGESALFGKINIKSEIPLRKNPSYSPIDRVPTILGSDILNILNGTFQSPAHYCIIEVEQLGEVSKRKMVMRFGPFRGKFSEITNTIIDEISHIDPSLRITSANQRASIETRFVVANGTITRHPIIDAALWINEEGGSQHATKILTDKLDGRLTLFPQMIPGYVEPKSR